jgi:hypothetical protein
MWEPMRVEAQGWVAAERYGRFPFRSVKDSKPLV